MFRVEKEIAFCFGHRLVGYPGKCAQLHGHNGRAVLIIESETLDELGMVMDFKELKAKIIRWVDDHLDHSLIMWRQDPLVPVLHDQGMAIFLLNEQPTTENIAKLLCEQSNAMGIPVSELRFWETPTSMASYRRDGAVSKSASAEAVTSASPN